MLTLAFAVIRSNQQMARDESINNLIPFLIRQGEPVGEEDVADNNENDEDTSPLEPYPLFTTKLSFYDY